MRNFFFKLSRKCLSVYQEGSVMTSREMPPNFDDKQLRASLLSSIIFLVPSSDYSEVNSTSANIVTDLISQGTTHSRVLCF